MNQKREEVRKKRLEEKIAKLSKAKQKKLQKLAENKTTKTSVSYVRHFLYLIMYHCVIYSFFFEYVATSIRL